MKGKLHTAASYIATANADYPGIDADLPKSSQIANFTGSKSRGVHAALSYPLFLKTKTPSSTNTIHYHSASNKPTKSTDCPDPILLYLCAPSPFHSTFAHLIHPTLPTSSFVDRSRDT